MFTATAGFINYLFKLNGITILQNGAGNTFTTNGLAQGDIVTVDVTNSNSCITTFNAITMTVNPLPTGTLIAVENSGNTSNDGIICTGATVVFTAPAGFSNYNFIKNNISVQNSASNTYTTSSLGTGDNIAVAVTNAGGCIGLLNTISVTVNALPAIAPITGTLSACVNNTTTLSNATAGGVWSSANISIAKVNVVTGVVTGVSAGATDINYTFTNANGCSTTVNATVTINALPVVAAITGNFNVCIGNTSQLSDATASGVWSSSNTSIATITTTGVVNGLVQGTTTISYTVTDANGCSTTATVDVTVYNSPSVAAITGSFNVCTGGTTSLSDVTAGGTWSSSNTSVATINTSGVVTSVTSGTSIIAYTITPTCGQPVSATQTITVNTPSSATINYAGGPSFCTSSGTISVTQTGTAGGLYSASPSGLTIAADGSITPSASTAGTYNVTYTVAASGGCGVYTATTSVTITAAPIITSFSYSGSPYCSAVTNTSPGIIATSTTGTYSYTVTAGGPTLLLDTSTGVINPSASSAGTYVITYTIGPSGGCSAISKTTTVTITANPTIMNLIYSGTPYCSTVTSGTPSLTASSTSGTYSSSTGLIINSSTGVINPSASTAGSYNVTYTIAPAGGCVAVSKTTVVVITTAPSAVAGSNITTCSNNPPVNITAGSSAANYSTIMWTSGGTGTFANANSLTLATYTPSSADVTVGSVTLTLKANGNGNCGQATSTKNLIISAPPAAFTLTPASASLCVGNVQPFSASANIPGTASVTFTTPANINLAIPDDNNTGAVSTLAVSGIPAGAVVNNVSVKFNINHGYAGELNINIKAPNGNALNLVNQKGGSGHNFTNTIISSATVTPINGSAPFTGTYAPDAVLNRGAGGNTSNVTAFSSLYGTPNGNWSFSAEDVQSCEGTVLFGVCLGNTYTGTITNWSITINYTTPTSALPVTWSPATDLFSDAGATNAYASQSLSTIYAKPVTAGTKTYGATTTNAAGCSTTQNVTLTVSTKPVVSISADYCAVPGKVRLAATSVPAASSYLWSTGATTSTIDVDVAGNYDVTAFQPSGCPGKATISVANELVVNGDFEAGDIGFTTLYSSHTGNQWPIS